MFIGPISVSRSFSTIAEIAEFIKNSIDEDIEVEAKSLTTETIPSFIMIKEEERRLKDFMHFTQNINHPIKHTFVINTNNKLINNLYSLNKKNPKLARRLAQEVYEKTLLSQKEFKEKDLSNYISHSTKNLEEILNLIT